MSKILLAFIIFPKLITLLPASKRCDFGECNYEGQCYEENDIKSCACIGTKYFMGSKCSEIVDNCLNENPCKNGGKCKNIVGQFICEDCNAGFGGLWCDLEMSNIFEKMLLYFNHYGFYGQRHNFLIIVENLGTHEFSLEFVADNYVIDSFETKPKQINEWIYSKDLKNVMKKMGIKYFKDLPYSNGFYHLASETFWDVGLLELTLRCYDSESATQMLYQNNFQLLLLSHQQECVPNIRFRYGINPLEPLMLDIASYNNFEILVKNRCFEHSRIKFHWSVYNSIGDVKLHDFGPTSETILKIQAYRLWFNYYGKVMSSYRLVVRMLEEYNNFKRETQARCFILVLPKPVSATIKGGYYREIGSKQTLILDASNSRDFALSPNVLQDFFYRWDCISQDDANNTYCMENMASSSIVKIAARNLQVHNIYNFTLTVRSKINKLVFDQTFQLVKITENSHLHIDIQCLRNCMRNEFKHGDILHLKAVSLSGKFSKSSSFEWTLEEQVIGKREHLIYSTKETDKILEIHLKVQDQALTGKARRSFKLNPPPTNGSCSIEPQAGDASLTNFHIKCENYFNKDVPLNYEYLEENGFPLQRTNKAEIYTKLPHCNVIVIRICDQFRACVENNLTVKVEELKEVNDLRKFLKAEEIGLRKLLERGDILSGMILLKSITKFFKTTEDVAVVIEEMGKFTIKTLLQLEQFLEISWILIRHNIPVTAEKVYVFNRYLEKLLQGLRKIVKDEEITAFKRSSYEKSCQKLLEIMQIFSQIWENISAVQVTMPQTILSSNPLTEIDSQLPDFDSKIAKQLESWLNVSRTLQECLTSMAWGAKDLYAPWEDIFLIKSNSLNLQMYAFDNRTQLDIELQKNSINITLSEACVVELKAKLQTRALLIQAVSLNSNPFWWYPSERPVTSDVFMLSIFESTTLNTAQDLKNPFEFQLKLKTNKSSHNQVLGLLNNHLHMPLYSLELPGNAVLIIRFLHAEKPLKFLIKINKIPKSFEVLKSGNAVEKGKLNKTYAIANPISNKAQAYVAVLLNAPFQNVTFSFHSEIRECLYWNFSLNDPQWSSKGCKPKSELEISQNHRLTCLCQHFSPFAARSYQPTIRQRLKESWILTEIPLNWYMVELYLSLTLIFASILFYNIWQSNGHIKRLPLNLLNSSSNTDMEIRIFTGYHLNATSTANISLSMTSQKASRSLTIYQDPENPYLKRNSMCKLLIDSQHVDVPSNLTISNDQSGRYPNWYCHKIIITNLKLRQKQIFLIDQWISEKSLEITHDRTPNKRNFNQRFQQHLSKFYINWYQFQPLWGCWLYDDLNRLERCCLELAHLMSVVCLVACYFGCTTLETYEAERELYYFLNFNILELLVLSSICYLIKFLLELLFSGSLRLLREIYVKLREKSKKIKVR